MFNLRKRIKKRIESRIGEFCYHELEKVEVKKKVGLFNYKCFHNACEYASSRNGCEVVMGIYINKRDNHPSLHFWCRDKNGKDLEVSMGYLAECYSYYEIRVIKVYDYFIIDGVFEDAMEYYRNKLTTKWERFILGKDRIL